MKLVNHGTKEEILKQKKKYLILLILSTIGIISGIIFIFTISKQDKLTIVEYMNNFFTGIQENKLNYTSCLFNSLLNNILYITIIFLLGISIIGFPIIITILFFKSFIIGFSFSSIIYTYGLKGIINAIFYTFPHQVIYLLIIILLSFYALNFSSRLFRYLFLKKNINFKEITHKYLKIYLLALIITLILSLYETYISTYLLKLFTIMLK